MLSFAAICPHPPLLIPSIGKEDILKVQETKTAMDLLSEDIEKKKYRHNTDHIASRLNFCRCNVC